MITGVTDPLGEEERLCSLIADSIAPRLVPDVDLLSVGERTLLSVLVYPSGQRPHFLKKEGPAEGVYVRLGSTNRKADPELIAELTRSCTGTSFDEIAVPDLTVDDLDLDAAKRWFAGVREIYDKELVTLRLLIPMQGKLVPTSGGVLLFRKRRDYYFPDAWVQCGRFIGTDKVDIFDHIEIHDHLPDAVESIIQFLKKHAMRGADFSEIRRKDLWSIPLTMLREAVINAIVHADYSQKGAPIRVAFFDDRIEIENPGILLPGLTIEDVKQGVSRIRNRVIARVFRELDLIEQWGSGFQRILRESEELGLSEPVIEEIGMRVRVTIFLAESHRIQVTEQVTEQVTRLINCLNNKEMSMREMMSSVGLNHRPTFMYDYLKPAMDRGFVEMTQPDSPKSPKQKYRLTRRGKAVLLEKGG